MPKSVRLYSGSLRVMKGGRAAIKLCQRLSAYVITQHFSLECKLFYQY